MKNFKSPMSRRLKFVAFAGPMLLFFSSCLKDHNTYYNPPVAYLSFVQASTDEPPINFFLNSNMVNTFPMQYGDHFDYIRAYTGLRTANFNNAATGGQLLSDTMTLRQNAAYTLFMANVAANPQALLLTDTLNKPAQGNATVRFVNMGPDAGAVDLKLTGPSTTTIANKAFKAHSGFVALPGASSYNLQVTETGTATVLASLNNINLINGGVYTVWFYGLKSGTNATNSPAIGIMTDALFN